MANLLVRGIDEALLQSLRERAAARGRNAETEHGEILAQALRQPGNRSLAEVLESMPNVGEDADFERIQDTGGAPPVFD